MLIRPYTPADYETVSGWWRAHKWPQVPSNTLPPNGLIVDEVCAGFLYCTDSPISWLEWVVADPTAPREKRDAALDTLIDSLIKVAKAAGRPIIFSSTKHPALAERYKRHGLEQTDVEMTNFIGSF